MYQYGIKGFHKKKREILIDASGSLLFGKVFQWGNFPSGDFLKYK